ncbi:MAG: putative metalloprotease CJM1_0395 family protein [Chitinivibrionales bacterium]
MGFNVNSIAGAYLGKSFTAYSVERGTRAEPAQRTHRGESAPDKVLTQEEKREVEKLKRKDREVRAHEQAHVAAGGSLVKGGASFEYQAGPDGKRYAVGGDVSIDTSAVKGDPAATIRKMQRVRKAALAPAKPSGQDRKVASEAAAKERAAREEKAKLDFSGENKGETSTAPSGYNSSGKPEINSSRSVDLIA